MLVSMLAATVGINVGHAETAAGAMDHVLTGGSSALAATVPYGLLAPLHRRGAAQEPLSVGSMPVLGRLVACEADVPE
jgi:hypothetical protein